MKLRRFRLTIGRMMIAIAIVTVAVWWAVVRPYPTGIVTWSGPVCCVIWSDETSTNADSPVPIQFRRYSWFSAVDFSDGRTRYYLTLR